MSGIDEIFQQKLKILASKAQLRSLKPFVNIPNSFCSNDYLGLSKDLRVKKAAQVALEKYGAGSGASRLVDGNHEEYTKLESALAKAKNAEAALVFGSGYLANIGVISALVGRGDLIVADRLSHACMLDGARLSGADLIRFSHNSIEHLQDILENERANYHQCLVITETVFSMDGDCADVEKINKIAESYNAWLLTDDAHGLYDKKVESHIQIGTLSKALGGYGGYVAASKILTDYIINSARSFIFSTALPASVIASANAALEVALSEKWRAEKALSNANDFCEILGLTKPQSQIVPVILGENEKAIKAQQLLEESGIYVAAIRPPTVPKDTARLRLAFRADHDEKDIAKIAGVVKNIL